MSKAFFLSLPDWAKIREQLESTQTAMNHQAREAESFDKKEYARGWYDALEFCLGLPNEILKGSEGEEEAREEDAAQEEVSAVAKRVVPPIPPRRLSGRF